MKLISANKLFTAFFLLTLAACSYKPESEQITGSWKYLSIGLADADGNIQTAGISDEDFLKLNADSTFEYHIASLKKHMHGRWLFSEHTLHLTYHNPDTLRHFEVDILSDFALSMHEGKAVFELQRMH